MEKSLILQKYHVTMKRFFSRTGDARSDVLRANIIVLVFVLAHAVVCLALHDTKIGDGAGLLEKLVPSWGVWINVIVTMVTTGLLGLVIVLLVRRDWHVGGKQQ